MRNWNVSVVLGEPSLVPTDEIARELAEREARATGRIARWRSERRDRRRRAGALPLRSPTGF